MLERIGNCRIVEEMASGGMAVVYRAIQDGLERTVAIKALKSAAAADEHLVLRFEREAKSLAKLQHENIIHVYDFHRERGAMFIVMEHVQGVDLYELLERCRRLPYDVAAVIALQVARALDYIHYRGILHRDIKPGNIMISRQGGVKVMDFGIIQDRRFDDLTQTGTGIGTPAYMSPEQILGDPLDGRSDIFSLGIVLYQLVTGTKPFVEDEERSVMHKIRLVQHVRASKVEPSVPRELDRIIESCLQKQPRDRWSSAQLLVMALERFLAKHVAINYHSRLVEFLRDQGIVPAFEAEEYLNPMLVGRQGSAASPNLAKQQMLRRGLFVQSGILLIVALMVGIIHLAPLGADHAVAELAPPPALGYVRVVAHPWGHVSMDGTPVGTTPMAKPVSVSAGRHVVTITHDQFEPVQRPILVPENSFDDPLVIHVDLEDVGARSSKIQEPPARPAPQIHEPGNGPEQPQ
jgi:predicted Ser/Thr protein kinase